MQEPLKVFDENISIKIQNLFILQVNEKLIYFFFYGNVILSVDEFVVKCDILAKVKIYLFLQNYRDEC